jgi:maleate isomerase
MNWRVGLLIPASNTVMEVDCYRSLPHDATLHVSRMHTADFAESSEADEEDVDRFVIPAATTLAAVVPHIVVFDCGALTALSGRECEGRLADRIAESTGSAAIGVGAATLQALRDAHASRVAVVTPYGDEANRRLADALAAGGVTVSALHGMGLSRVERIGMTSDAVYAFVQSRIGPRVAGDALFIADTTMPAMSALSLLKISYDVPIVTCNLAVLQSVKRELEDLRQKEMARLSS